MNKIYRKATASKCHEIGKRKSNKSHTYWSHVCELDMYSTNLIKSPRQPGTFLKYNDHISLAHTLSLLLFLLYIHWHSSNCCSAQNLKETFRKLCPVLVWTQKRLQRHCWRHQKWSQGNQNAQHRLTKLRFHSVWEIIFIFKGDLIENILRSLLSLMPLCPT